MAVRYEGEVSSTSDLEFSSSNLGAPFFGSLSTLLLWNQQDPPDDEERLRNGTLCHVTCAPDMFSSFESDTPKRTLGCYRVLLANRKSLPQSRQQKSFHRLSGVGRMHFWLGKLYCIFSLHWILRWPKPGWLLLRSGNLCKKIKD